MKYKSYVDMTRSEFYRRSFTWGLPLSLIGAIVCGVLMIRGYKPKRYGYCYYIAIGKSWGGLELGWFFLTDKNETEFIKNHELGHGYQNTRYGFIMPILSILSACRYWLKQLGVKIDYYSWWFEKEACEIGNEVTK